MTRVIFATTILAFTARTAIAGWIEWPVSQGGTGHFYRLTNVVGNWLDAEAEAVLSGADLVTINSAAENQWVLNNIAGSSRVWIGLYQDVSDPQYSEPAGGWKWISGEPVTYTNWANGEPNNTGPGTENWAEMSYPGQPLGTWNDTLPQPKRGVMELVPEPCMLCLVVPGIAAAFLRKRRCARAPRC